MKKIYNQPTCLVVELGFRKNVMLTASVEGVGGSESILGDGGPGDGTDIAVKGVSDVNVWDNEW